MNTCQLTTAYEGSSCGWNLGESTGWGVSLFKGWVRANALSVSRPGIDIEDTTTSTCWGSKCLWSQLLSFLLNLWVLPLVAIGTWETQGLRETMTLLCGLLGGSVRPIPCPVLCLWHAEREVYGQILQPIPKCPYMSFYYTDCVYLGVRRQLRDCSNSVRLIVFCLDSSFKEVHWVGGLFVCLCVLLFLLCSL